MAFDYNNLVEETIVVDGFDGKIICVFGGNNLGKSGQSTNFPKSVTLPLEPNALNAIGNAKKLPVHDWASFVDFTESIYSDKIKYEKDKATYEKLLAKSLPEDKEEKENMEARIERLKKKVDNSAYMQFRNNFTTLVLDSLTALGKSSEKYITDEADVQELGDVAHGKLYKRYENEAYHIINKFFNLGDFTYLVLAHEDLKNIGTQENPVYKAFPKGDWKRIVKPVIDRCDIVAYLKSNGVDADGKVIPSSAYLAETEDYFARTKWENMDTVIPVYTADNFEAVIKKAIAEQKASGVKVGTYSDQQRTATDSLAVDFKETVDEIITLANKLYDKDDDETMQGEWMTKYRAITEKYLGDKLVSETNKNQIGQLVNILSRTRDLVKEMEF